MRLRFHLTNGPLFRQTIRELKQKVLMLNLSLSAANKLEKEMRKVMVLQNDRLQSALLKSTGNVHQVMLSSDDDSSGEQKHEGGGDAQHTLGTVSTELMEYRYDELSLSYQRCLKYLFKKDKKIVALQQKIETLHEEIEGWRDSCRFLETRTEKLCRKYLALHSRKDNEIFRLKAELESCEQMVSYLKTSRHSNLENMIESVEKRDVILLNEMMKCDKLVLKNIQLAKQIQLLQSKIYESKNAASNY